ncbi:cytochrome c oxidase subunit NDUFA4-like [Asterias rubens]|uniref:cytochrome c oxidase subunit NDUFA4-like n=1 Tax=Asterias rubens TaxID=7604 RepID=UPI0014559ABA|nr:cytochrome c oxidase subunit NDUFA4-like [Asterias rubens]
MQGLSLKSLRSHYALVPLFVSVVGGAVFAAFYVGRLALKNPDAAWDRKNNPHPWTRIKPDQNIKFYAPGGIDFKNLKANGPDMK